MSYKFENFKEFVENITILQPFLELRIRRNLNMSIDENPIFIQNHIFLENAKIYFFSMSYKFKNLKKFVENITILQPFLELQIRRNLNLSINEMYSN